MKEVGGNGFIPSLQLPERLETIRPQVTDVLNASQEVRNSMGLKQYLALVLGGLREEARRTSLDLDNTLTPQPWATT